MTHVVSDFRPVLAGAGTLTRGFARPTTVGPAS